MKIVKHQKVSKFRLRCEDYDREPTHNTYLCEVLGEHVVAVFDENDRLQALWTVKDVSFIEFKEA